MTQQLLTDDYINKYPDFPEHMNELGKFVFYRTYSRYLPEKQRRETWKETVRRATEYNVGLGVKHMQKLGQAVDFAKWRSEAELLFDNMFNLRQFLSGRTLWIGGADGGVADKYPLANFNCSFVNITSWRDFGDMFYLLMVGTGAGFKSTKENAAKMKPLRDDLEIIHEEYTQKYPSVKEADTRVIDDGFSDDTIRIEVGDSKEGWVDALRAFFDVLADLDTDIEKIEINYDYIRPRGTRLNTFGGTASGHEPLRDMFEGIMQVIRGELDEAIEPPERVDRNFVKLRPVHMLDIGNLIGNNVVVGGVRRTAEIFLFDPDDYESLIAKYGINGVWNEEGHREVIDQLRKLGLNKQAEYLESLPLNDINARPLHHRRMSNNSIAFTKKPSKEFLDLIFAVMKAEGEPGFINLETAAKRRLAQRGIGNPSEYELISEMSGIGLNPCAEILLDSYGVCNLTTVNLVQFVKDGKIEVDALLEAQRLSARAGLRMTLVELEIPHWDKTQQRDRLLGTSLTGEKDAMESAGMDAYSEELLLANLGEVARHEADRYAKELRVSSPLLVTTVKPEGTLSQVAGGVSSGLHYSHSPYFIRRIRINANDPLAQAVKLIGWKIHAEVGTPGETEAEKLANAKTFVIDFPVKSGAKTTKDDVNIKQQFDNYYAFQRSYTEHNSSNTISVKPDEWSDASQIVYDGWNEFVGVSFLAHDGGSYYLAPYEAIDEATYNEMASKMKAFDPKALEIFDRGVGSDLEGADGCEGGACPIR